MEEKFRWTSSVYWYPGALFLMLVCLAIFIANRPGSEKSSNPDTLNQGSLFVDYPEEVVMTAVPVFAYEKIEGFPREEIRLEAKQIELPGPADYMLIARSENWIQKYPVHIQGFKDSIHVKVIPPPAEIPEDMVFIPAGEFRMGAKVPLHTVDGADDPARDVEVETFLIDKTEVSNTAFAEFVQRGGYRTRKYWSEKGRNWLSDVKAKHPRFDGDAVFGRPNHPVVGVSWYEADAYCRFKKKRLPNEAEWEKAARGPEGYRWSFGNVIDSGREQANYFGDADGYHKTAPVDAFTPNSYGLFGMSGNVWEWVDSEYGKNDKSSESWYRVLRGGSWGSFPEYLRAAYRGTDDPGISADSYGFRCARDL